MTTDRGSNEIQARKHILNLTSNIDRLIYLETDCFEHGLHLAVLGGLMFVDELLQRYQRPWKYYSSLAVLANCARDSAKDLFKSWESLYGCESAMQHVQTLLPKCISSRWGSVNCLEERLLKGGMSKFAHSLSKTFLQKVLAASDDSELDENFLGQISSMLPEDLQTAFASKAKKARSKKEAAERCGKKAAQSKSKKSKSGTSATATLGGVDLLAMEELNEYTARVNRWQRHLLLTVNDRLFAGLVAIMNKSRQPIIHLSSFVKKTSTLTLSANSSNAAGGSLFQLVTFKALEVETEFDELLCHSPFNVRSE